MDSFVARIKSTEGNLNFYFNEVIAPEGFGYHVSTIDGRKNLVVFFMFYEGGEWIIKRGDKPGWLTSILPDLRKAIVENTK